MRCLFDFVAAPVCVTVKKETLVLCVQVKLQVRRRYRERLVAACEGGAGICMSQCVETTLRFKGALGFDISSASSFLKCKKFLMMERSAWFSCA